MNIDEILRMRRERAEAFSRGDFTYNPDQPRDPAGTSTGGQWTSTGGSAGDYGENLPEYDRIVKGYAPSDSLRKALDAYSQNHARLSDDERRVIEAGFKTEPIYLSSGTVLYRGVETDIASSSSINQRMKGAGLQSVSLNRETAKEFATLGIRKHSSLIELHIDGKVPVLPIKRSGQSEFVLLPMDKLVAYRVAVRKEGNTAVHTVLVKGVL